MSSNAQAWQARPLDAIYPIVYLDCIVVKIRDNLRVVNKAIYLALGVNLGGHEELLGLWISDNEGAKFWLGKGKAKNPYEFGVKVRVTEVAQT